MRTQRSIVLLVIMSLFGLLGSCANQAELSGLSKNELAAVDDRTLCEAYHYGQAPNVVEEIKRRGLISRARLKQIQSGKINTGLHECAMFAAMGSPDRITAKTADDPAKIYIYKQGDRTITLFSHDDRITDIRRNDH
ncbi:MAG: hypothetical protein ABEK50_15270 [bacterium]